MKNKKGFTLVELLAILILLAIILSIAIPKIAEIIEDSQKSAYANDVKTIVEAVKLQYETRNVENDVEDESGVRLLPEYTFNTYGQVDDKYGLLKIKGDLPSSGKVFVVADEIVDDEDNVVDYDDTTIGVVVDKLVSKNGKWCASKNSDTEDITVGKATEMDCFGEGITDKSKCKLEKSKTTLYIDSVSDMYEFSKSVNSGKTYEGLTVKLRKNIEFTDNDEKCGETQFNPIGTEDHPFKGTFDGNDKKISNINIIASKDNAGLFGYIDSANIHDLTISGIVSAENKNNVGLLAGYIKNSDIYGINIEKNGTVKSEVLGYDNIGGLIGKSDNSDIYGIIIDNIKVTGTNDYTSGSIGYYNTSNIKEIMVDNISIVGNNYVYGLRGANSLLKKGTIVGHKNVYFGASITEEIYMTCDSNCPTDSNKVSEKSKINGVAISNSYSEDGIGDINFYESIGMDTWIGADNDSSGYYFDYESTTSNNVVLKSKKKSPITFTLSGSGTKKDPYIINNENDWKEASTKLFSNFVIKNNLNFASKHFYMMGSYYNQFTGTFNGNFNRISNVKITSTESYIGLFGYMDDALIQGFRVANINFTGNNYIGGLIGYAGYSVVYGIDMNNIKIFGNNRVGSLIGKYTNERQNKYINEISVDNIDISGLEYVGGVIGDYELYNVLYSYWDSAGIYHASADTITDYIDNILLKNGKIYGEKIVGIISGSYQSLGRDIASVVENIEQEYTVSCGGQYGYNNMYTVYCYTPTNISQKSTINENAITDGYEEAGIGDISFYEALGLDTWIGGDNNSSGYYFDYESDSSNNVVLKSVEKDPITFTLEGSGTSSDPYIINNEKQWKEATTKLSSIYALNSNIDFSNKHFYMLGSYYNIFQGNLIGRDKLLSNVQINASTASYIGLSGYTNGSTFSNLKLKDVLISAKGYTGSLAGYFNNSQISEINANGITLSSKSDNVGGLIGYSNITNSQIISNISVSDLNIETTSGNAGGLIGSIKGLTTISTTNISDAKISGSHTYAGGLIGCAQDSVTANQITINNVNASGNSGGLIGLISKTSIISDININKFVGTAGFAKRIEGASQIYGVYLKNMSVNHNFASEEDVSAYSTGAFIKEVLVDTTTTEVLFGTLNDNYTQISNILVKNGPESSSVSSTSSNPKIKNLVYENGKYACSDSLCQSFETVAIGNISFYESLGLDTYIGGDNDSSGYYFDYASDTSNSITLKKTSENPITFNLSGSGTSEDPYIINNESDWKQATTKLTGVYKINNNLNFSNKNYYMMGSYYNIFKGTILGDNKKISNVSTQPFLVTGDASLASKYDHLSYNLEVAGAATNIGLFGYTQNAKIQELNLENISMSGYNYIGGLIGYADNSTIENINVQNINSFGDNYVGGLIGYIKSSKLKEIDSKNLKVYGTKYVGGIMGYCNNSKIYVVAVDTEQTWYLYKYDSVNGTIISQKIGGLIGVLSNAQNVIKEVVLDNIEVCGPNYIGGLIGQIDDTNYTLSEINNILLKRGLVAASDNYQGFLSSGSQSSAGTRYIKNSIIEDIDLNCGSNYNTSGKCSTINLDNEIYASNISSPDGIHSVTDSFDSDYIDDLSFYSGKIETMYDGDVNNTGYFFDNDPLHDGRVWLVKAYEPVVGDPNSDPDYHMSYINTSCSEQEPPVCTLISMTTFNNGFQPLVVCTDNVQISSFRSYFDSRPGSEKAKEAYEDIGNDKPNLTWENNGAKITYNGVWRETNKVGPWPRKGLCYYFRYGAMDTCGNYSTDVSKNCYSY